MLVGGCSSNARLIPSDRERTQLLSCVHFLHRPVRGRISASMISSWFEEDEATGTTATAPAPRQRQPAPPTQVRPPLGRRHPRRVGNLGATNTLRLLGPHRVRSTGGSSSSAAASHPEAVIDLSTPGGGSRDPALLAENRREPEAAPGVRNTVDANDARFADFGGPRSAQVAARRAARVDEIMRSDDSMEDPAARVRRVDALLQEDEDNEASTTGSAPSTPPPSADVNPDGHYGYAIGSPVLQDLSNSKLRAAVRFDCAV